ncbi:erg24, C-14 sterol reductase, partial [Gonapodya sp. JEL0774]
MAPSPRVRSKSHQTLSSKAPSDALNPRTEHFEFLGTFGAVVITIIFPVVVYGLHFACNEEGCPALPLSRVLDGMQKASLFDPAAFIAFLGWIAWFVLLFYILPGEWVPGTELRNGKRLQYKINAWSSFLVTAITVATVTYFVGFSPFLWITDHFVGLMTASVVYCMVQAIYLYASSFRKGALLALGGNSGKFIYDFFIGRELNPRIGLLDLKCFFELRPGLIGWMLLDIAFAVKQYTLHGHVTDSMVLVVLFQSYYVMDGLWFEKAVLTTIDIIQDGFGYMLTFGDLAWVPFTYSLQTRYLAHNPLNLGPLATAAVVALELLGMFIFRASNGEKNNFRTDPEGPNVRHLKYITTKMGNKLITSGWWGMARHINYLGDWLMAWAWCLPTGFATPITYFYVIYFGILLVHRDTRDYEKCSKKYGSDWDKYCK